MKVLYNNISNVLSAAGLSHSEQRIYLLGMNEGLLSSQEIIHKTNMPRPTVMAGLKSLSEKQLCDKVRRDGRSYRYAMLPAQALKAHVGEQIRRLDTVMDRLDEVVLDTPTTLHIQEAHGQKEVQVLLEMALRCKSRKWLIIAPQENALRFMPQTYIDYFKKTRRERQIESQTLWEEGKDIEHLSMYDLMMRKPRHVPRALGKNIPCLQVAFDDYLLVIDGTTNPSAALIHNASAAKTFSLIFEMAWRSAKG